MEAVTTKPLVRSGLFVAVVLIFSWIAAGLRPFTQPENAAVAVPALIVLAVSWRRSDFGKSDAPIRPSGRGIGVWATLLILLTMWELAAYASSPREKHPTLSSIIDTLMSVHVGRAASFFGWLLVGWGLFLRPKRVR
jgi:hypothetical protein